MKDDQHGIWIIDADAAAAPLDKVLVRRAAVCRWAAGRGCADHKDPGVVEHSLNWVHYATVVCSVASSQNPATSDDA
ncbi:MAG TPA: hypothetical protein VM715_01910 [Candidatus Acidoferrum sp.]|nr:hypothetical protein [Candidatus Acidoferrum sp.]